MTLEQVLPDVLAPGLRVLFCGINPGLYSAEIGHHYAGRGNRFWQVLYAAGFTPRVLSPLEDYTLTTYGCGLTNLVARATAGADALTRQELVAGRRRLQEKVQRCRPAALAILGLGAYRQAFEQRAATVGPQPECWAGAAVWVLPNPSGRNAHYQLPDLVFLYRALYEDVIGHQDPF